MPSRMGCWTGWAAPAGKCHQAAGRGRVEAAGGEEEVAVVQL